MRNFNYLKDNADFATLYLFCNDAELNQMSDPNKSALKVVNFYSRRDFKSHSECVNIQVMASL